MKQYIFIGIFILCSIADSLAQNSKNVRFFDQEAHRKGKIFINWGYNRDQYTNSNITFKGDDYNFTLKQVGADDLPESFNFKEYFSPVSLSIPQYNFGFGYYLTDRFSLSLNIDHMKYLMAQGQTTKIDGYIDEPNNQFNGNYNQQNIKLIEDFLTFEHTDGLNYLNVELSHTQEIYSNRSRSIAIEGISGIVVGAMIPKSNVKLFNYPRHDHFHVAGYGLSGRMGLNFLFLNKFFIQSNIKGGFIDMPSIVTRSGEIRDRASQNFFFLQKNIVFGVMFKL